MNKIYKVVWSKAKHCYVVASELAKRNTKGCGARSLRMAAVSLGVAAALIGGFGTTAEAKRYEIKIDNVDVTNNLERIAGIYTFQGATKTLTVDQTMIDQKTGSNKYFYGNVVGPSGKSVTVTVIDGEIVTITDYYSPFAQQVINESPFNDSGELKKDGAMTTVGALVQAGPGASTNVSGYSVTLTGTGLVDVAGALSYSGSVSNNSLTVNGGAVTGDVYGGTTTSGDASYNAVTINSGTVSSNTYGKGNVYGGNSYYGNASYNAVTVNGGTVTGNTYSKGNVYGGNTSSGEATYNTVTITGGTISQVYGGYSNSNATNNTVTIQGGTVGSVTGAYSSKEANNNTVNVSKGTVGTSAGSYAVVGAANDGTSSGDPVASGNRVTVTGTAQVTGLVIGARDAYYAAVITDNTVTIDGSAVVTGDVFGGYGWVKDKTLNKVYVKGGTVTGNVYGVELNSSYSSDTGNATSNEVHISGGTVSGSVYGGAVKGKVSGDANSNKVEISGGEVKTARAGSGDSVYGGYSETGHANSNKVQVSGESTVKLTVYGGVSKYEEGTANNNEVTVSDSANLPSGITAGWSPNKDAKNNTVTIEGGSVKGYINGGVATGVAENNHIIVNGGTVSYLQGGSGGSSATGNTVEINGGTVTDTIYGGNSDAGTVTGNAVTVNKGTVNTIYGGYSNSGTVTNNTVTVSNTTLNGAVIGGTNGDGDANGNTVSIAGGTIGGAVWGGYSRNGDAKNNTVTVTDMVAGRAIYGGYAANLAKNATGNTVSIKNVTAPAAYHNLQGGYTDYTAEPTGNFVTGNTLIISGTNKFGGVIDNFETIKLANDFAWKNGATVLQGKFGVNYDGTRPALNITDAETALSSATSGSMTLLASSSANDFSTLSLIYSGGTATLDASKPSQEVLSGEGSASEDKGVTVTSSTKHTVSLDQANSYKNVLYTVETGLASKISLGDMAWETPRALSGFTFGTTATVDAADLTFTGKSTTPLQVNDSRTLVSGATGIASLPAANITQPGTGKGTVAIEHTDANGLKFNATATGTVGVAGTDVKYTVTGVTADSIDLSGWKGTTASTVPTGWTGAGIAVSGSFTEPEMEVNSKQDIVTGAASGFFTDTGIDDAIKYKEGAGFTGDEANGVTLAGKQSKGVQAADSGKKLVYAVGAKEVTEVTLGNMAVGTPRTMEDGYDFSGVTTITASDLQFDKPENVKTNTVLVANAAGLAAGKTVTDADHTQVFTKTAENQVVLSASLKGTVETAANAVNYKYGGTELTKVDLANWNGASSDASSVTDGWTLGTGASVSTGDLAKAGLTSLKPGETKTILTVGDTIAFTDAMISGAKKWQDGGPIDDSADTSGVTIAGSTTGGGVKVNDSNAHQLIYQQDKKEVTSLTIGSVAYDTSKAVRTFGSGDDLTGAKITVADGFSLTNLDEVKTGMYADMVIVDATEAVKGTGGATLQEFAKQNAGKPVDFSDKIDSTVLTFSGTHQDTLEQNEAKTQIVYKVGDKNVEAVTLDGSVTWDDSKAYYENKADANGKFAYTFNGATNVDAENLKVAGTSNALLKADGSSSMTLLSAAGMSVNTFTDQSDANKAASKVSVNYKDDKGVAFKAEAKGEVKAEAAAVKYSINEVKLTDVDLSGWTGSESSVPDTWTAEDGSVKVATGSFAEPDVAIGSARTILTAGSAFFADDNISGANKYDEANGKAFSETQNNVTVSGTQAKGVAASEDSKSLVYKVDIKKADTVSFGATNWQKGATLFDGSSATEYDYANVTAVDAGKFDVTYASPETVAAGESMTLLKANETLTAIINEEKAKAYSFSPVSGVTVDAAITGKLTNSGNNVVFTAAANQASKLTFGDVEWKDSGALLTRPGNITFASADVDTSKINFTNMIYLDADRQMTLVSDFGDKVGTITGSKYLVGTAFEGEGAASLSGSDLVFRTKTGAGVSEQTHKTVMATEVGVTMLNTGNDYIDKAMEGMGDLANVAPDGTTVGAAIGGGRNRYETGSHVNVNSWNAAVAVGAKRELKNGSLEYGVFGEYGKANFTLHSDAGKGDGDSHYAGGGLVAKWTNKHDVYTEASFRLGRLSESSSDIMRDGLGNTYGYDVHANYYGAHVGVGKIFRYNGGRSLDVYGKYFYTKRNGVEFDAVQHYNLDSVSSSVLRIGARYGTTDKKWNWYGGLAYEYEFDGEAEGVVNGVAIRAASIKGSSVRGEIGMRMNATKTNPWQMDISLYGYGGKHRGFGGNVNVAYMF